MRFDEFYGEIGDFFAKRFPDGITQTEAEAAARALEAELAPIRISFQVEAGSPTRFRMALHKDDQEALIRRVMAEKLPKARGFA
jgi:hypothetical protein